MVWSSSLEEFSTICCDPHSQRLYIVNKAEVDGFFLEFSCLFNHSMDVGNLMFGSFASSKSILNIRKFLVNGPLKRSLEDFEYYFSSIEMIAIVQ